MIHIHEAEILDLDMAVQRIALDPQAAEAEICDLIPTQLAELNRRLTHVLETAHDSPT